MSKTRHTILGLFFFAALVLLGVLTISLGGFATLRATPLRAHFADAGGLRSGDPVTVYGVRMGRVDEVEFTGSEDPDQRLLVTLSMEQPVVLREGYEVRIEPQSLLGGRMVGIETGEGEALPPDLVVQGTVAGDVLKQFEEILEESGPDLGRTLRHLGDISESVATGQRSLMAYLLDDVARADLNAALRSARDVAGRVAEGDGTLARLINEGRTYERLNHLLDRAGEAMDEVLEGDGTLSLLLKDDELYRHFESVGREVADFTGRVNRGEGLLGKLGQPESEETWEDVRRIANNLRSLSDRLEAGEGVAGRLFTDEQMGEQLAALVEELSLSSAKLHAIIDDVRGGRGIVGWLVADDQARRRLDMLLLNVSRAVEDAREAAPVTSFTSFLFGQF